VATRHRLAFLPVFLTLLSVAFAGALAYRVRVYRTMETAPAASGRAPVAAPVATPAPATVAETGTLVPAAAAAQPAAPVLTREQRYRELLAMGNSPEAAAVQSAVEAQQQPPPRVVPAPQPAPVRPLKPVGTAAGRQPSSSPPGQPASSSGSDSSSSSTKSSDEPADPNSDTTPPQLIAVEFNPPQIHDGEETMLIITADDDISGIRGISGTLTSPTGKALQGFAQQREGESKRYISRVTIPKDAEEGTWKISFLNMSDLATNMSTLNFAQGTIPPNAVLKVISSRSDSSPPTLRAVSIGRRAMHTGESNSLFIEAEDDKSGVRLVSAVFVSPAKQARLGYGCKKGDGDNWECSVTPPECLDCGEWQLEQVQMQDNANNYTTVRADNPLVAAVRLNIAGATCDSGPPVIQNLALDKPFLAISQGDLTMTVRVQVSDDSCGIGGLSGQVTGPGTNAGTFFAFSPEGGEGSWVGTFRLDPKAPRGIWKVQSVTVNDKGQNLRIYYASDPVLARGQFVVK